MTLPEMKQHHLRTMEKLARDATGISLSKSISKEQRMQATTEAKCFNEIARFIRASLPENER